MGLQEAQLRRQVERFGSVVEVTVPEAMDCMYPGQGESHVLAACFSSCCFRPVRQRPSPSRTRIRVCAVLADGGGQAMYLSLSVCVSVFLSVCFMCVCVCVCVPGTER